MRVFIYALAVLAIIAWGLWAAWDMRFIMNLNP